MASAASASIKPSATKFRASSSKIVKLNVGGKVFATTLDTISSAGENLLSVMIAHDMDGTISTTKDSDGSYFLDRDPKFFGHVLNYLRTGEIDIDLFDPLTRRGVARELDYFGIEAPIALGLDRPDKYMKELHETPLASTLQKWVDNNMPIVMEQLKLRRSRGQNSLTFFGHYRNIGIPASPEIVLDPIDLHEFDGCVRRFGFATRVVGSHLHVYWPSADFLRQMYEKAEPRFR